MRSWVLLACWALLAGAALGWNDLPHAKAAFLEHSGDDYGYGGKIDELHRREIAPRLPADEHYLDFTGSSLYWNSQMDAAVKELEGAVYGNPHSANPSSQRTEQLVEALRLRLLRFLGADPAVYDLVWTRSGTGAMHNLGETFPWTRDSRFAYLDSNHNSVLGIREYARKEGAAFGAVSEKEVEAWLQGGRQGVPSILRDGPSADASATAESSAEAAAEAAHRPGGRRELAAARQEGQPALALPSEWAAGTGGDDGAEGGSGGGGDGPSFSLFAFPAYDNYGGTMYPLRWVRQVQAKSTPKRRWKVLLDAAAFLPSHPLNLTETPADFVGISFYKLFGYPTGVGAWVARAEDVAAARKVYWGGGSVFLATATLDWKQLRPCGPERFEDGTLPFLNILGLQQGLDVYEKLGGQAAIERHTNTLRDWLAEQLPALRHSNGAPLLRVLGHDGSHTMGATFNFQILKPSGEVFSYRKASAALAEAGFHARCGCTCNPGACYGFVGVTDEEVRQAAHLARGNFSDWEWVWVCRPVDTPHALPGPEELRSPAAIAAAATCGGDGGKKRLVKLPLGSLRASLGYMSRFEDAYALVSFLRRHYTDRAVDDYTGEDIKAAEGASGSEEGVLRLQRRRERRRWAELQGPGWC